MAAKKKTTKAKKAPAKKKAPEPEVMEAPLNNRTAREMAERIYTTDVQNRTIAEVAAHSAFEGLNIPLSRFQRWAADDRWESKRRMYLEKVKEAIVQRLGSRLATKRMTQVARLEKVVDAILDRLQPPDHEFDPFIPDDAPDGSEPICRRCGKAKKHHVDPFEGLNATALAATLERVLRLSSELEDSVVPIQHLAEVEAPRQTKELNAPTTKAPAAELRPGEARQAARLILEKRHQKLYGDKTED